MTLNLTKALILTGTFSVSVVGSGLMRRYALNTSLLDVPNLRSSHASPTPRGGGLAIATAFFVGTMAFASFGLLDWRTMLALTFGGLIAWIGFLDDKRQLSARLRFGVHVVSAATAIFILEGIPALRPSLFFDSGWTLLCSFSALFALAWATNLFNFMDGIDGLAGSEAIFVSSSSAILNSLNGGDAGLTNAMMCTSAASLGFLLWNWPPARLFMGDVGSGFLGFTLTLLALAMSWRGPLPFAVWPILGGVFLVDASVTLVRRIIRGDVWFEAHRMHAYQHLARRWQAHSSVTVLAVAINVIWLFPLAFCAASYPRYAIFFMAVALVPLVVLALQADAGKHQ